MNFNFNFNFALVLFSLIVLALGGVCRGTLAHQPNLTFTTQNGQIYNCVDFDQQPAFKHPLLKHLVPKVNSNVTTSIEGKFNGKKDGGCPSGTVPIIQSGEIFPPEPHLAPPEVHCYAVVRTVLGNSNRKFYGSNAVSNIYNPEVNGYQWSASRLKLMNGPDSIEAGWIVFPDYFKDKDAHLYVKFTAGSSGCLNLQCPGFVQVAGDMPLGQQPPAYSDIAGKQIEWDLSIDRHSGDGNWWVTVDGHQVGYWPSSLFSGLKDAAAQVEWGGEINDPGEVNPAPVMGSSFKATYELTRSAYFSHITVADGTSNYVVPAGTELFYDCPRLYTVLDWGDRGGDNGRVISYGGSQNEPGSRRLLR